MKLHLTIPPKTTKVVAIDTEAFGQNIRRLHRNEGTFASIQVAIGEDVYIVQDEKLIPQVFENLASSKMWVFHNAVYDLRQMRRYATIPEHRVWDTMLVERNLWNGYYARFGLKDVVRRYLDIKLDKESQQEFSKVEAMSPEMLDYAAKDPYYTLKVYEEQLKLDDGYRLNAYFTIDEPSIWTFIDIQPVKIDRKGWTALATEMETNATSIESGLELNTSANARVVSYINHRCGKSLKKPIEDASKLTLQKIAPKFPFVQDILQAKAFKHAASHTGLKWIADFVEEGDYVYTDWKIIGAKTGRVSSSNPALQNIPARTIPRYRDLFIQSKGLLTIADISAQEPRILAWHSNDKRLRQVFEERLDPHLTVARDIFHDQTIEKDDKRRDLGKAINLGTSYGLTPRGLAARTDLSEDEAEKFMNAYFNSFRDVKNYINKQRTLAQRHGYIETASGRRTWINPYHYGWANIAINAPIQGGGSDFLKLWAVNIHRLCAEQHEVFPMVLQVHDEIVLDHPKAKKKVFADMMEVAMLKTAEELYPGIPFEMECKSGLKWSSKKLSDDKLLEEFEEEND